MIFYVLTQSPETSFFRADRKFQLLVETMDAFHVLGTKQIENKGGYLGQIPEDIFHFSGEPFVFRAVGHNLSLRKTRVLVAPNRLQSHSSQPRPPAAPRFAMFEAFPRFEGAPFKLRLSGAF